MILIIEALLICGTFVFFNVYNGENDSGNDRKHSRYSLDEANENAELAYGAVEKFINNTYHPQDYAAHGYFLDAFSPDEEGELSEELSKVIDDGYVMVLLHHREDEDFYDDLIYTVQWCEDESGDGIVGQYPEPIEEEYKDAVQFGTSFKPDFYSSIESFRDNFYFELDDDGNIIITRYKGKDKNVVIPEYVDGVKIVAIGGSAFLRCRRIESVIIPGSVKEIGGSAFNECDNLKSVVICEGVETIGACAFFECDSLEYVEIPDSVETIEQCAFKYCYNLKEVDVEDGYRFMFKDIFTCSFIFYEYLFKTIAIGLFVITIIIILIVSSHKKRRQRKAKGSIQQEAPSPSDMQNTASAAAQYKTVCPQCAAKISPDAKFCGKCGQKL